MGYYGSPGGDERNSKFRIHVLVDVDRAWEEGALKVRGLLGRRKLERPMLASEVAAHRRAWRAVSYRYESLEGLVEDERRVGASEEFIKQLESAFADLKEDP